MNSSNPRPPTSSGDIDLRDSPGAELSNDAGSDYLITIQIDPEYESLLDSGRLHSLAIDVLKAEKVPGPLEMGVAIASDEEVRTLNRDYLGHDYETDVLSFGMVDEAAAAGDKPG